MFGRIKEAIESAIRENKEKATAKTNLSGYKDSVLRMLSDMKLDDHEIAGLQAQQRSLNLSPESVRQVHRELYSQVVTRIFADDIVTEQELEDMLRLTEPLGLDWRDLPPHQLKAIQIAGSVINIKKGRLPVVEPHEAMIRTNPGEIVHAEIYVDMLDEKTYRHFVGGSSGVSVRIMKGVSYRTGSTRGRSIPVTEIVVVDSGLLSVTNKRVAFIGNRQNFASDWTKVLSASPTADGISFSFSNRKKTVVLSYQDPSYAEYIACLLSHFMS